MTTKIHTPNSRRNGAALIKVRTGPEEESWIVTLTSLSSIAAIASL
jgi:hypothetical protein